MTVHCPPCSGPDVGFSPVMVGGTATAPARALPGFEPACAGGTARARNSAPASMRGAVVREEVRGFIGLPPTRAGEAPIMPSMRRFRASERETPGHESVRDQAEEVVAAERAAPVQE